MRWWGKGWWLLSLVCLLAFPAQAQRSGQQLAVFEGVGIEEQLGERIPLDLTFRDEAGQPVTLRTFFDGRRPVLLTLVYHDCPMLCNLVLDGLAKSLRQMAWTPGEQFEVLAVSFNHRETPELARRKKAHYVDMLGRPDAAAGLHFLTGDSTTIRALTDAVGFSFRWVPEKQQFAHPAVLIFLSGEGKISRYLYGLEHDPGDVRKALVEASEGKVGTVVDQVLLYCFQYDPSENSYVANAYNIMRLGGAVTVVLLGITLFLFWRRERRRQQETLQTAG
ncbi:SCO family protein [Rhodothermus marinus]|uniref:Electron transport protein SCO1/SenC n=1 Tax=Rhodothermus marinus (strain ATCC 43812 / DSM 4252 / R-10) TaxID=518766 RepID=D0MDE1_RHOM4|nr:SCO family protein [Rhodothermus marinus]ACY47134.1 electron transport protein SCO1/SenC [Rhodothermus marinus DSM 4252]AEN72159.1 electron transport protein SCO1/SenC [Rhodothermus marinus SG0.5JP17-172]